MKATVAYESPRRQRQIVRPMKWHRKPSKGYLYANGVKGTYSIRAQKPNRRLGIFKWCLELTSPHEPHPTAPIMVKGAPMSLDDLSELKAFASSYDAMPPAEVDVVIISEVKALESPTREEWEVIVVNPPAANRGAILNMAGPGDGFEAGNKIILQGFHDDTQAANVGAAIAKRYKVQVTFGPKRTMEAAETPAAREQHVCSAGCRHAHEGASEAPRRRTDDERRYPLKWNDTPKGNSFAHGLDGTYYVNGPVGNVSGWLLTGPRAVQIGTYASKQAAEDEAEREEFIERRNTRMRGAYRDEAHEGRGPLV